MDDATILASMLQVYLQFKANASKIAYWQAVSGYRDDIRHMLESNQAREKLRKAMEKEFLRAKNEGKGHLQRKAAEIGIERQQMQQYAAGTTIPADVLLMAFMTWGITVRIEDEEAEEGEPKWWEFSMSGRDRGLRKPRPSPAQMSLFDALNKLRDDHLEVKILRKGPGRLEVGLEIGFKQVKF